MMKITPQMIQIFGAGFIFGAIFFTGIIQVIFGRSRRSRELAAARAFAMRSGHVPKVYSRIRQTDIKSRLTRSDLAIFRKAEKLEAQMQYLEAASLFERVRFQRRAIDILERAGLITEAAQVLIRLNAPGRAAAIYERNARLELAWKYYQIAGQYKDAGLVCHKLAAFDNRMFVQAAECFIRAKEFDLALDAMAQLLSHDEIARYGMMHRRFNFLTNYMRHPENAQKIFLLLGSTQLATLIDSAPPSPQTAQTFVTWSECCNQPQLIRGLVYYLSKYSALASTYWKLLSKNGQSTVLDVLVHQKEGSRVEITKFAEHLFAAEYFSAAAEIFYANENYSEAALTYWKFGQLDKCRNCIERLGLEECLVLLDEVIGGQTAGPWSSAVLARAEYVIKQFIPPLPISTMHFGKRASLELKELPAAS